MCIDCIKKQPCEYYSTYTCVLKRYPLGYMTIGMQARQGQLIDWANNANAFNIYSESVWLTSCNYFSTTLTSYRVQIRFAYTCIYALLGQLHVFKGSI